MRAYLLVFSIVAVLASCNAPVQQDKAENGQKFSTILVEDKGNVNFTDYFQDKTMRVDYFHSGTSAEEHFSRDKILSDGPWPGSREVLVDPLKLGLYYFEVIDKESNVLLYSRGFASIFGEWQTTGEADREWGTFHESIRFPWPNSSVTVVLSKRDAENNFRQIWSMDIDPASRKVNPVDLVHKEKVYTIYEHGPAGEKVDFVILGDGYTAGEMEKFRQDAKRLADVLVGTEPYRSRITDINIRAVETPSEMSGISRPHPGIFKRTALSAHFSSFDSERYVLAYDNRTLRNIASAVPYDFMVILFNEQTYGGGGIYNLYTTVSADNKFADYIMVHEMGHHLAALADEYYTSSIAYEATDVQVEPWETNITALLDKDNLKWKELVDSSTPVPTPWNKEAFDSFGYSVQKERDSLRAAKVPEEVMEALFMRQKAKEDEFFAEEKYLDEVGTFEGAGYQAKGLYRPQLDCIMFTRHMHFCKVCQKSISDVMDLYTR